ncbi:hypothetical protein DFQ27_003644 [Actinomortierella ambigua]|uniref:Splicing factor YJU2 n=1 Tax=Actinomortierella ambigua TaxID=1343610 RepID=A0A9P6Q453_9FUNG|nr:hypothetical protein DFQ27_003644 [Actinomortierella ambigua]
MSERKVLNKYFPPDFDPAKIPRRKINKDAQQKVRLMTPFSMRCLSCGEYIYKGKKFNARKETTNEMYLSTKIFRFYIRCNRCAAEITFKTDPKNADYLAEHGAVRNFEPWKEEGGEGSGEGQDGGEGSDDDDATNNPMKALENRTLDSKREMEIMDALDEIRTRNAAHERVDADSVLDQMVNAEADAALRQQQLDEEEDDRLVNEVFKTADGETVKRIRDDTVNGGGGVEGDPQEPSAAQIALQRLGGKPLALPDFSAPATKKRKTGGGLGVVSKRKGDADESVTTVASKPASTAASASASTSASAPTSAQTKDKPKASAIALLGAYGSDSDSEDE